MHTLAPRRRDPCLGQAFTLVEAIVMLALAVLVTTILWQIFVAGHRQARQTDLRLTAIQSAQLLVERIRQDMVQAVYTPTDPVPLVGPGPAGTPPRLNLLIYQGYRYLDHPEALYQPQDNDPSWIEAARVSYAFDPATHVVSRLSPGHDERLSFARFLSVSFRALAGGGSSPSGVRVDMLCASQEALSHPGGADTGTLPITAMLPFLAESNYLGTASWMDCWFHQSPKVQEETPPASEAH